MLALEWFVSSKQKMFFFFFFFFTVPVFNISMLVLYSNQDKNGEDESTSFCDKKWSSGHLEMPCWEGGLTRTGMLCKSP
jgi:hypothetical protein